MIFFMLIPKNLVIEPAGPASRSDRDAHVILLIQAINDLLLPLESAQYHALSALLSMMIKQAPVPAPTVAGMKDKISGISMVSGQRSAELKSIGRILPISNLAEPFPYLALLCCEC
jgi:hypothetical protein